MSSGISIQTILGCYSYIQYWEQFTNNASSIQQRQMQEIKHDLFL